MYLGVSSHDFLVHIQVHNQTIFVLYNLLENDSKSLCILQQVKVLVSVGRILYHGHDVANHTEDFETVRHFGMTMGFDAMRGGNITQIQLQQSNRYPRESPP
jgi:hypothetical protein